jgi:hypothetical protein
LSGLRSQLPQGQFFHISIHQILGADMFVRVECLWDEGRPIDTKVLAMRKMNCLCGELRLQRQQSDYLAERTSQVARLINGGFDSMPPLQDAVVVGIAKDHMLIVGLQKDEVSHQTFVQSWRVEILELMTQQKVAARVD